MTNADRIRHMTDEELAKFMDYITTDCMVEVLPCYESYGCTGITKCCYDCIIKWLTMEEEEL